jgi:hypothetical protein
VAARRLVLHARDGLCAGRCAVGAATHGRVSPQPAAAACRLGARMVLGARAIPRWLACPRCHHVPGHQQPRKRTAKQPANAQATQPARHAPACSPRTTHLLAAQHHAQDVGVHNCLQVLVIRLEQRTVLVRVGACVVDPACARVLRC